ncbi:hypothetical protein [Candidatus Leptofilum sp.]|uniref:hypothetical protein n=1 Tax=Candidatus Leptofilum sp. TaxID=3241576 RepID=UPI003B5B103E
MHQQEQHSMELVETFETGAEEWHCPTCDRRFVVQWPPKYRKIILAAGDEYALHSGGKGSIQMHSPEIQPQQDNPLSEEWLSALDDLDFDSWPDNND